jgi:hypothetical protein
MERLYRGLPGPQGHRRPVSVSFPHRMNRRQRRRLKLFEVYSANLALHKPELAGHFGCPICGRLFDCEEPLGFDFAHTYPQACGGRIATLACCDCNSHVGAKFESALAREYQIRGALSGKGSTVIKTRIFFPTIGKSAGAEVTRRGDHYTFNLIPAQTNPADFEVIKKLLDKKGDVQFTFDVSTFNQQSHSIAILHAAFLTVFWSFGYEWLYYSDTRWIRTLLQAKEPPKQMPAEFLTIDVPRDGVKNDATGHEIVGRLGFALINGKHKCIGVALPTPDETRHSRVILLPSFGPSGQEHFDAVKADFIAKRGRSTARFFCTVDDPRGRLADPHYKFYGHWLEQKSFSRPDTSAERADEPSE